jgi:hypothetical protein
MTKYSDFLNQLKQQCDKSWLTPSQMGIFKKITTGLKNHRIINIYSIGGCGKTFLGWVLEKEKFGKYFINFEAINGDNLGIIIVDNFPPGRENHRKFRSEMGKFGISKAIVITQYAIPDDIPSIQLQFNEEDRNFFKHICYDKLRLQIKTETGNEDMHALLKKNIWE